MDSSHKGPITQKAHYTHVIMGAIAPQITSLTIVYSTVYSDVDRRKHQISTSLAFVRGIHRAPVHSPHKWPVTRKMFPFDDVIMQTWSDTRMILLCCGCQYHIISLGLMYIVCRENEGAHYLVYSCEWPLFAIFVNNDTMINSHSTNRT